MPVELTDPGGYALNIHAIATLLAGIAIFCLGVFVLLTENWSSVGVSFFLMCLSIGVYLSAAGMDYAIIDSRLSAFWIRVSLLGTVFIPGTVLLKTLVVFGQAHRHAVATASGIGLSMLFGLSIIFGDLFVKGTRHYPWGSYGRLGPAGMAFVGYFFGVMLLMLFMYAREYGKSSTVKARKRIRGLFIAFCGGYLGSVDFLPALGVPVYPFGYIPIFFFIFVSTYIVVRYRLVDITPETASASSVCLRLCFLMNEAESR